MPLELPALLARAGLTTAQRRACLTIAAIARADWSRLQAVLADARAHEVPRAVLEETLLQATLFCGFPRTVSAFEVLNRGWPVPTPPAGGALPAAAQAAAGSDLFATIYRHNDAAVRTMLAGCHGEFLAFVIEAAYGRILSRPGLPPLDRELLAVAALAALDQLPQLIAHGRGALHFGAGREALHEAILCGTGVRSTAADLLRRCGGGPD